MDSDQRDQDVEKPSDSEAVQLALAARAGSREALGDLIRLYTPDVLKLLLWMVRSLEDAEDLAQETFIKVNMSLCRYEPTHPPLAWVLRIAKNTALDFLRKRQRLREQQRDLSGTELELVQDNKARQDWVLEVKEVVSRSRETMDGWVHRFLVGERQSRARQAVFMALDGYGADWRAIAKACKYKTRQSAKNAVTKQIVQTLESAEALAAARSINAELERYGLPQPILFLGLVDLNRIENSNEEDKY